MTASDFCAEYPALEAAAQERFRGAVTRLLSGKVITSGTALKPDPDWRFLQAHGSLVDAYLRIGGWRLDLDLGLRIARAVHEQGEQRVRFTKHQSLVLCLLRLAYHEDMQRVTEDGRCELRVGDIRERIEQLGRAAPPFSRRILADALRRLARHSIVGIERGFEGGDSEVVLVTPLIEKILPGDRITEVVERVRAYSTQTRDEDAAASGDEPEDEVDA